MELNDFLSWMLSGGVVIAASWIAERWAWFQTLSSNEKEWTFFGFASAIWMASYSIVNFVPAEMIEAATPYFLGLSGLFITIIVGKFFHSVDKE